jgi:hypothetical protein
VPTLNEAPRHEGEWESGGIAKQILNPGTTWKSEWSVSRSGRFTSKKQTLIIPTGYEAGWAAGSVWTRWRRKKDPAGNRIPIAQPVGSSNGITVQIK